MIITVLEVLKLILETGKSVRTEKGSADYGRWLL